MGIWVYGNEGGYSFTDDTYNFTVNWKNKKHKIIGKHPEKLVIVFK